MYMDVVVKKSIYFQEKYLFLNHDYDYYTEKYSGVSEQSCLWKKQRRIARKGLSWKQRED